MRFVIFLAAFLLSANTAYAEDSSFVFTVSSPSGAPEYIVLLNVDGQSTEIELKAKYSALDTSLFSGKLPAGRYQMRRYKVIGNENQILNNARTEIAISSINNSRHILQIRNGITSDFGRYQLDAFGGNLALLIPREDVPDATALMPEKMAQANVGNLEKFPHFPLSADEKKILQRSLSFGSFVVAPYEQVDGSWVAVQSNGNLWKRTAQSRWQKRNVFNGERLVLYSEDASLAVSEFGRLWDTSQAVATVKSRLPSGIPYAMACSSEKRCVVALRTTENTVIGFLNATNNEWKDLLTLPWKSSMWSGQISSLPMFHSKDEVLFFHGKEEMTRISLSTQSVESSTTGFRVSMPTYNAGRITSGKRYTDDMGRTWGQFEKRMRDGNVQMAQNGKTYATSLDLGFTAAKPILRTSPDGKVNWTDVGPMPSLGELRVGRYSPQMYLIEPGVAPSLWVSIDNGVTWIPDEQFIEVKAP
jgi:hypothetical protein